MLAFTHDHTSFSKWFFIIKSVACTFVFLSADEELGKFLLFSTADMSVQYNYLGDDPRDGTAFNCPPTRGSICWLSVVFE
jgi:hypothetical protein